MKKALSIVSIMLCIILMCSCFVTSASAATTQEEPAGYSYGVDVTRSWVMYVGESKVFGGIYTYDNISDVSISVSQNGVCSFSRSGTTTVRATALKPGTATIKISISNYYYGPNYSYDSKYDTITHTITVKKKTSSSSSSSSSSTKNLATPKITKTETVSNGIKLTWGKVSGAAKYRLFWKSSSGWKKVADTTSTSYLDKDVSYGKSYTYTVRCMNSAASKYTSSFNGTGWKHTYVKTPQITKFETTSNGIKLTWGKQTGAAKYRVYYKNNGWKKLGDTTGTSYTHKNLTLGKKYTYTVRAITSNGSSFTSYYNTSGKSYTYVKSVATPKITKTETVSNGIKLTIGAVTGAQKYRIYWKSSSGWKKVADTTSTSYLDKDVSYGKSYVYTVRCINSSGSAFMSSFNGTGWKHTYAATPRITSATSVSNGIKLSWNSVTGAGKYRIYWKSSSGWKKVADTTSTSYIDTDVSSGHSYTYTVRALSADGKTFVSYYDTTGKVGTYNGSSGTTYSTPKINSVLKVGDTGYVEVQTVSNVSYYALYYKNNGSWSLITTKNLDNTYPYIGVTGMKEGSSYTFAVAGVDSSGNRLTNLSSSYTITF